MPAQPSSYSCGVVIPVGTSRGRGHMKTNIEAINNVNYKTPLRKPGTKLPVCSSSSENNYNNNKQVDDEPTINTKDEASNNRIKERLTFVSAKGQFNDECVSVTTTGLDKGGDEKGKSLNPNAKEFVPGLSKSSDSNSNKRTAEIEIIDPKTGLPVLLKSESEQQGTVLFGQDFDFYDTSNDNVEKAIKSVSEAALTAQFTGIKYEKEVIDVLELIENMLMCDPGLYITVMAAVNGIFRRWSGFEQTLKVVAQKIMKQSTTTKNYSYIGAKICSEFDKITFSIGIQPSFRSYILNESENEFTKLKDVLNGANYCDGYEVITFIADLYVQLTVKEKRIKQLGCGVMESLSLLSPNRDTNIFCMCKILKLVGWALDEDFPSEMEQLKKRLPAIKQPNLETSTTNMLNSVINLAANRWGRGASPTTVSNGGVDTNANGFQQRHIDIDYPYSDESGKVYGAEGVVLSDEEIKFFNEHCKIDSDDYSCDFIDYDCDMDDGVVSDNMDDEACEAYEQFLLMIPNSKRGALNNMKK